MAVIKLIFKFYKISYDIKTKKIILDLDHKNILKKIYFY